MSTVVAACVAVASAEAAEPADTITNRASLILCFLPTAMATFVCIDGDSVGGRLAVVVMVVFVVVAIVVEVVLVVVVVVSS